MVAQQFPIHEHARTEHRLGQLETRDGWNRLIQIEAAAIPKGVPLLRFAPDFGKRRLRQRDETWNRDLMIKLFGSLVHRTLADLPNPIQRKGVPRGRISVRYCQPRDHQQAKQDTFFFKMTFHIMTLRLTGMILIEAIRAIVSAFENKAESILGRVERP